MKGVKGTRQSEEVMDGVRANKKKKKEVSLIAHTDETLRAQRVDLLMKGKTGGMRFRR